MLIMDRDSMRAHYHGVGRNRRSISIHDADGMERDDLDLCLGPYLNVHAAATRTIRSALVEVR